MSGNIILNANITVPNGPKISFNRVLTVEAYDKIDVTIPPTGTSEKEIELQPSASADQVQFLLIISDWYGEEISYKVNANTGTPFVLNEPHLLIGKGAVSMLGSAPTKLLFSNTTSEAAARDAKIQILIGRDATPP